MTEARAVHQEAEAGSGLRIGQPQSPRHCCGSRAACSWASFAALHEQEGYCAAEQMIQDHWTSSWASEASEWKERGTRDWQPFGKQAASNTHIYTHTPRFGYGSINSLCSCVRLQRKINKQIQVQGKVASLRCSHCLVPCTHITRSWGNVFKGGNRGANVEGGGRAGHGGAVLSIESMEQVVTLYKRLTHS